MEGLIIGGSYLPEREVYREGGGGDSAQPEEL